MTRQRAHSYSYTGIVILLSREGRITMPVYEYECARCRVIYEVRQGMSDPPLAACPRCTEPVNRIILAPNLNRYKFSRPTEAKYAKVTPREEIAKEREIQ